MGMRTTIFTVVIGAFVAFIYVVFDTIIQGMSGGRR